MTFDIGVHEVCVRVGVRYVITKFSRMDSLPNFVTHGVRLRARELRYKSDQEQIFEINILTRLKTRIIIRFWDTAHLPLP